MLLKSERLNNNVVKKNVNGAKIIPKFTKLTNYKMRHYTSQLYIL